MAEERELVQQAKSGSATAFEALVTAYESKIYNLSLRYLGNREDAMDASQEVFLRVFRFLPGFQEESGFSTWIYRIAVNVCKDALVQRAKRAEQPLEYQNEDEESRILEIPDERYRPEELVEQSELKGLLADAILTLPEQQRQMIIMRDVQGLRYEEIGEILSLELGTVKSRISRAREKLRKKLLQNGNNLGYLPSKEAKGGKSDENL